MCSAGSSDRKRGSSGEGGNKSLPAQRSSKSHLQRRHLRSSPLPLATRLTRQNRSTRNNALSSRSRSIKLSSLGFEPTLLPQGRPLPPPRRPLLHPPRSITSTQKRTTSSPPFPPPLQTPNPPSQGATSSSWPHTSKRTPLLYVDDGRTWRCREGRSWLGFRGSRREE